MLPLNEIVQLNNESAPDAGMVQADSTRPWHPNSLSDIADLWAYLPNVERTYQGHLPVSRMLMRREVAADRIREHFLRHPIASYALGHSYGSHVEIWAFQPISSIPCDRRGIVTEEAA